MPERSHPADNTGIQYETDRTVEEISPETLRQEDFGHLMIELQTEFREAQGIEGGFILGED